jgi:twin arginine-targeting protein translocase, TatA/E family
LDYINSIGGIYVGDLLDNPLKLVLIFAIVLVLFGANRIPEMGKGLGEGIRNFKKALSGELEEKKEEEKPKEAN